MKKTLPIILLLFLIFSPFKIAICADDNSKNKITELKDYDIAGLENERTIIFIHGTRVTRKMWLPQMKALSDTYRVVAPDLPGHGSKDEERFTLKGCVEYISELIDELTFGKALVVGISSGGYIVSEFAYRCPEKTTGAVLAGASAVPKGPLTIPHKVIGILTRNISTDWMIRHDTKKWREKYPPDISEPIIEAGFYHYAVKDVIDEIVGIDFLEELKSYKKPLLIINGENDIAFRRDQELYNETIENSELIIIEGIGHVCNLVAPEEFNSHLRRFADSLDWE